MFTTTVGVLSFIPTPTITTDQLFTVPAPDTATPTITPAPTIFLPEIIRHGSRNSKEIALTFDGDMNDFMRGNMLSRKVKSYYDKRIIDTLMQTNTKATIFLTGMWIELYPTETKALAANPLFELGNHSYSHPSFDGYCYGLKQISDRQDKNEVEKTQNLLKIIAGIDNHLFRFPGGCYSQKDVDFVHKEGLVTIDWDVVGQDGFNNNTKSIEDHVLSQTQNGSIIILHLSGGDNAPKTFDALSTIITSLKDKGFIFVKISELLQNGSGN